MIVIDKEEWVENFGTVLPIDLLKVINISGYFNQFSTSNFQKDILSFFPQNLDTSSLFIFKVDIENDKSVCCFAVVPTKYNKFTLFNVLKKINNMKAFL